MALLDDFSNGLKNIYGNGGPGDALIGLGMGLLSQRGVGRGLTAGLGNVAQMSDLSSQRKRQETLDKLAQERESRQAANQAWQQQWAQRQAEQQQHNADRSYNFQVGQAAQPPDEVRKAQWIAAHPQEAAAGGLINRAENDTAAKEKAIVNSRLQQGQSLGLTGDELNRYALTGQMASPNEKVTNDQANAALFSRRMAASNDILSDPKISQSGTGWGGAANKILESIPLAGNALVPKEYQQARQAQEDFINAVLRRESGAAISSGEYSHANRQYFPQPGDSEEVIRQKAANRENAMKGILGAASPGFQKSFATERSAQPQAASGSVGAAPAPKDALDKAREIIRLRPDMKKDVMNELLKSGVDPSGL